MSVEAITRSRLARKRKRGTLLAALSVLVVAIFAASLMIGQTFYGPGEVLGVLLGETVPGASFTVGELRLPRATVGLLAGIAFGLGGVTFQSMLRNALASPDVIGISSGASAAAVMGIVVFSWSETLVSVVATFAALAVAGLIYFLSHKGGSSGTRLILIGIGIAAMLDSLVTYVLSGAAQWDLPVAMRWLSGSLNSATFEQALPLFAAVCVCGGLLLSQVGNLETIRLGDATASGLGVNVERSRILLILSAVGLIAFATAATGPIAFVAFLAGPIAARIMGPHGSPLIPAALVGALLVLVSDLIAQFAFDARYPVGVVTGVLGAPYLIYLLIRTNRKGASL